MFEAIYDLYSVNKDFINGGASVATLGALGLGIVNWTQSRQKKIFYSAERQKIVTNVIPSGFTVEISGRKKSSSALFFDKFILLNNTDITITDIDFVSAPLIAKKHPGVIYEFISIDSSETGLADLQETAGGIEISVSSIPRSKALIIGVFHDGCLADELTCIPKNLPDLKRYKVTRLADRFFVITPLTLLSVYIFTKFIKLSNSAFIYFGAHDIYLAVGMFSAAALFIFVFFFIALSSVGRVVERFYHLVYGTKKAELVFEDFSKNSPLLIKSSEP